jgi:hypothetical protein
MSEPIEIQLWEPVPNTPGYTRVCGARTLWAVLDDIEARLRAMPCPGKDYDLWNSMDYFHIAVDKKYAEPDVEWPKDWRWIACYAVTGSSEGEYIHVDVIDREDKRTLLYLGKTFCGMPVACAIASALTEMLGA